MQIYLGRFKDWYETNDRLVVLILFVANFFLVYAVFTPNFSDLNPWDEAAYIASGQELIDNGVFPSFAGNPLTYLFFALTYLPFRSSPLWMVQSVSLARIILFTLLWLSTYKVTKQLSHFASPVIALGFLLVTPLSIEFLRFPSDPLFASFAGFSLWQLLLYRDTQQRKFLLRSSMFMALAALARNDGLILFGILVLLTIILSFREKGFGASILAVLLPFMILVGGYVGIYGLAHGDFSLGTMERTYENFESGQQIVFSDAGGYSPVIESRLEAARLFGTAEENDYSVFKAIQRNPEEYFRRVRAIFKILPERLLHAYGIRFSALIFILLIRGIVELLKKRQYVLILILCLWPLHLVTGFIITIFREGHLQFHFYIVFVLAAVGLVSILSNLESKVEITWISVLMLGLCVYGVVDNKLAIFYGSAVFVGAIWIIAVLNKVQGPLHQNLALLILFCAGIILRGNFPSPTVRELGSDPKEQAILYIVEQFSPGTTFAAGSPGVIWASKMGYAGLASQDVPKDKSPVDFIAWMREQGIEAIYVDHNLYNVLPSIWELIEPQIGISLERIFETERGNYQVLLILR
jgi:hypothetical protein